MERRLEKEIGSLLGQKKGLLVIVGDTYTGKSYCLNKVLKIKGIQKIAYDFEDKTPFAPDLIKRRTGRKIGDLFKRKDKVSTPKEVLVCDALESYPTRVTTFVKNAANHYPVIAICDKSVVISKSKNVKKIHWKGEKYLPDGWKGDTMPHTPRDLMITLTQRRVPLYKAISHYSSDTFILTQYYHDEYLSYSGINMEKAVKCSSLLSYMDMMRTRDWDSNGMVSTSKLTEEIFVREIRQHHRSPSLIPKGWFPRSLSKGAQITRRVQEMRNILRDHPNIQEIVPLFNYKDGRSFAYKKRAKELMDDPTKPESYSRGLELMGYTGLTKTEIKKII